MVAISYGHGYLTDCNRTSGDAAGTWAEVEDGNTGTTVVLYDDYFHINISASVGNKQYYWNNGTNLGLSSSVYTKIRYRYKTSDASIKAAIALEFSDANTQTILADSSSTTFTSATVAITTGKTIDHIRFYANNATGDVYYDFALIYKTDFTIPSHTNLTFHPPSRYSKLGVPGKVADHIQNLGSESAWVDLECDMDVGTWKRSSNPTDMINGEVFMDIAHNSKSEAWQWLDTEKQQFKCVLEDPAFQEVNGVHTFNGRFTEISRGGATNETYVERFGINL